jgi:peptide methionine sulfoxide reductase msrA/msrB
MRNSQTKKKCLPLAYAISTLFIFAMLLFSAFPVIAFDGKNFKKPTQSELKKKLSSLQYEVTQEDGTERPYKNEYWDEKREGIYVDIVSNEPLFLSTDKYDSKTGWPSFTKPIDEKFVTTRTDKKLFLGSRIEVRSRHADSHLGHVFDDGPQPTGKRYCMNSAAMRFIPKEKMADEGYGQYLTAFGAAATGGGSQTKKAIFAAGCFWCIQPPFDKLMGKGVKSVTVGYAGGSAESATYEKVSSGKTKHLEVVEVQYDPTLISYKKLLDVFWVNVDPLNGKGQFCDNGEQYLPAIFADKEDEPIAKQSIDEYGKKLKVKGEIKLQMRPAATFYAAEEYHQAYYKKNSFKYSYYRSSCGRDKRLKEIWGDLYEK